MMNQLRYNKDKNNCRFWTKKRNWVYSYVYRAFLDEQLSYNFGSYRIKIFRTIIG